MKEEQEERFFEEPVATPEAKPKKKVPVEWGQQDWSLSNDDICLLTGRCYVHVSAMRGKYAWGTGCLYREKRGTK